MSAANSLVRVIPRAREALASDDTEAAQLLLTATAQELDAIAQRDMGRCVRVDGAELGTLLRRLRRERSLSIEALAFAADLHPTYLPEIELGKRNPSLGKLSDLALALGLPLSAVIREAERRTRIARLAESIERAERAA